MLVYPIYEPLLTEALRHTKTADDAQLALAAKELGVRRISLARR